MSETGSDGLIEITASLLSPEYNMECFQKNLKIEGLGILFINSWRGGDDILHQLLIILK